MSDAARPRAAARERRLRETLAVVFGSGSGRETSPTLLPHLAAALALEDLPALLAAARRVDAGDSEAPHWPRLIDAVCARVARRLPAASASQLDGLLRAAPAALYSCVDASLVHDALRTLLPDGDPFEGAPRALRLCRLAARHPGHAGGVLVDLASAALIGLPADQALVPGSWFFRLASDRERQRIVAAWCESDWPDAAAATALFDAATASERDTLSAALLSWLARADAPLNEAVSVAAAVAPLLHGQQQAEAVRWLDLRLGDRDLAVPDWWRTLALSWLSACAVPLAPRPDALSRPWLELADAFAALPELAHHADVLRAHPGASAWLALDGYPGLSAEQARAVLRDMASDRKHSPPAAAAPAPADPGSEAPVSPAPHPAPETRSRQPVIDVIGSALGSLFDRMADVFSRRAESTGGAGSGRDDDRMRGDPGATGMSAAIERRLQADVTLADPGPGGAPLTSFCPGRTHTVAISIGQGASVQAGEAFAEPAFEDAEQSVTLDVRLVHDDKIVGGSVELPRNPRRDSDAWSGELHVAADAQRVEAIVVVLHNGRVLQAARLSGPVRPADASGPAEQRIALTVIADVHQFAWLESRTAFDASVLATAGSSAAFAGDSFRVQDLRGVEPSVNRIMDRLFRSTEAIAMAGAQGDPQRQRDLLVYLAVHGKALHGALIKPRLGALDAARRIQIVNLGQSPILPLELIYSGPSPTHDATLCDGWQQALETGQCPSCTSRSAGTRVPSICPLGFWALSKVIERHAPGEPRADGYDYRLDTCVPGQRDRLAPLHHALFAASENVPEHCVEETLAELRRLEPHSEEVRTWADWSDHVQNHRPTLLVSMPHNALDPVLDIPTLEIGRGSDLRAGEIGREHVCAAGAEQGPVVLLLGCQTAQGGPLPYHTFVSEFRGSGAAIVIGTLATVLGEHAAPIVQMILSELAAPQASGERTFGDVLLRMRRRMFARGILIALAVAAFGDADWSLPLPEDAT